MTGATLQHFTAKVAAKAKTTLMARKSENTLRAKVGKVTAKVHESTLGLEHRRNPVFDAIERRAFRSK